MGARPNKIWESKKTSKIWRDLSQLSTLIANGEQLKMGLKISKRVPITLAGDVARGRGDNVDTNKTSKI